MNQSRSFCFLLVVVVALVGGAIRLFVAQNDGLWLDELHTAWATGDGLSLVGPRAAAGNQSGLYYWMVWGVRQVLGDSTLSLRTISLVTGILLIFLATHLTWDWTRSAAATFVVGWLIAIDPQFVFYGTEARPYGIVELMSIVQVWLFWNWLTRFHVDPHLSTRDASTPWLDIGVGLIFVTSTMFYLHSTSVWLPVSEGVFFAGYSLVAHFISKAEFRFRSAFMSALLIGGITTLSCLPAIFEASTVYERRGNWAIVSSIPILLNQFRWPLLLSIVLPTILAAIFYSPNRTAIDAKLFGLKNTERTAMRIPFVLLWAVVPIACVLLLDRFQIAPLALSRYTLVGAAAIPIFCGLCVGMPGKVYGQLAVAAILVGVSLYQNPFAISLMRATQLPHLRFENWSSPIGEINARRDKAAHPVFLFANVIEDTQAFATEQVAFQEYLQFPIHGIDVVELDQRIAIAAPTISEQHFRPTDIEIMKEQGGAWLLIRGERRLVDAIIQELIGLEARMAELTLAELIENRKREKKELTPAELNELKPSPPQIRLAQFPGSIVSLVAVNWLADESPSEPK